MFTAFSEDELQAKLNVAWRSRSAKRTECLVGGSQRTYIRVEIAKVGSVEGIKYVSLKLQLDLLAKPDASPKREIPGVRARPEQYARPACAATSVGGDCECRPVSPAVGTAFAVGE